jgi:hypothetical protein
MFAFDDILNLTKSKESAFSNRVVLDSTLDTKPGGETFNTDIKLTSGFEIPKDEDINSAALLNSKEAIDAGVITESIKNIRSVFEDFRSSLNNINNSTSSILNQAINTANSTNNYNSNEIITNKSQFSNLVNADETVVDNSSLVSNEIVTNSINSITGALSKFTNRYANTEINSIGDSMSSVLDSITVNRSNSTLNLDGGSTDVINNTSDFSISNGASFESTVKEIVKDTRREIVQPTDNTELLKTIIKQNEVMISLLGNAKPAEGGTSEVKDKTSTLVSNSSEVSNNTKEVVKENNFAFPGMGAGLDVTNALLIRLIHTLESGIKTKSSEW